MEAEQQRLYIAIDIIWLDYAKLCPKTIQNWVFWMFLRCFYAGFDWFGVP